MYQSLYYTQFVLPRTFPCTKWQPYNLDGLALRAWMFLHTWETEPSLPKQPRNCLTSECPRPTLPCSLWPYAWGIICTQGSGQPADAKTGLPKTGLLEKYFWSNPDLYISLHQQFCRTRLSDTFVQHQCLNEYLIGKIVTEYKTY